MQNGSANTANALSTRNGVGVRIILQDQTQPSEFAHFLNKIDDWKFLTHPRGIECADLALNNEALEFLCLGTSSIENIYAMGITPFDKFEEKTEISVFAILIDPPKHNEEAIKEIFLRVRLAFVKRNAISQESLQRLVNSVSFPTYRTAGELLPGLPVAWEGIPAEIEVTIQLSDGACLYPGIFKEYKQTSFSEVLETLYGERNDGILLGYSLVSREVTPLLLWDIDWPLARAGEKKPTRRKKVSIEALEKIADPTLLEVHQYLPSNSSGSSPYYGQPTIRLRVGGFTEQTAITNWQLCAKLLREIKKSMRHWDGRV